MPRPRRFRRVGFDPIITYFKPAGIRLRNLDEVVLTMGEFEAVRLKDHENLDQSEAAKKMNISQPTFHRLLLSARKKIAEALTNGKAIRIQGGVYKMAGKGIGMRLGRGLGRGRMGGFAAGPDGDCICPECGHQQPHARGQPCAKIKCPECDTIMTRK
ncbi:DUF134 domain-containing protein [Candidatus Woesearchaeota archaeon]|nr:DUF134 domain-containing protein [Candidatus Woesearchaeota archaeon]